jgi:hypothetical protein
MNILLVLVLAMVGNATHNEWRVLDNFHTPEACYAAKKDYFARTPASLRQGIFCCVERGDNKSCKTI